MATIKSHTDIEQSKKLAEILPLESADMYWDYDVQKHEHYPMVMDDQFDDTCIRAWSLAGLLNVLPKGEHKDIDLCCGGYKGDKYIQEWFCSYEQQEPIIIEICNADNPVDACVDMIIKLHELNLL